jgi:hypothetical protein
MTAIMYETQDSKGVKHNYLVSEGYAIIVGEPILPDSQAYFPLVGGAKLGDDFSIAYEERNFFGMVSDPIFTKVGTVQDINLERIAVNPPRIGDHLIIKNALQEKNDPRNGLELLRGKVTAIKKLEDLF